MHVYICIYIYIYHNPHIYAYIYIYINKCIYNNKTIKWYTNMYNFKTPISINSRNNRNIYNIKNNIINDNFNSDTLKNTLPNQTYP